MNRPRYRKRYVLIFLILMLLFPSGCSPESPLSPLLPVSEATPTPEVTPTATPNDNGYPFVFSPYCKVGEWNTIQTEGPQGDLMAWSPVEDMLAWIEPGKTGNWSAGNLVVSSGPLLKNRAPLNIDALAFGNLSWSSDGKILAFVALRRSDTLYTVITVDFSGDRPRVKDQLPDEAARTDNWGSDKAIIGWKGPAQLEVASSCGPDCDTPITIDLTTNTWRATSDITRKSLQDYWKISNKRPVDDPTLYPPMVEDPSWSQDDTMMSFIDERNNLWAINLPEKTQMQIPYYLGYVQEVKWSSNSRLMTVRNESQIFLLSMDCS